ncbi:MAG: class I adenylate cyclase, partial [Desulfobacteraceae bacterium]|nr:class I adenylate cyclase [Desulfobacteraceae bacterium]
GKIPSWALIYQDVKPKSHSIILNSIPHDAIDFGTLDYASEEDILKGLLWHVLKSFQNPVKALIKATMIFSYWFGGTSHKQLLCNALRAGYSKAGLDDYSMDPYKILFDRVLEYHEQNDTKGLSMIKSALFFRLCGYPSVKMPPENFPQRHLLEKYIYNWGLQKKQVTKLLGFQKWSESEKLLFEQNILTRLKKMYEIALHEFGEKVALDFFKGDEQRNWKILQKKTKKNLRQGSNKISDCSSFLKMKKIKLLRLQMTQPGMWEIIAKDTETKALEKLYSNPCLFEVFGWILANRLYDRNNASIDYKHKFDIYEFTQHSVSFDHIYLSLQPLVPLSDSSFDQDPTWKKSAVLLIFSQNKITGASNLDKAEFLITNTWGEIFFEDIEFNQKENIKEKYEKIALKLVKFYDPNFRFFIYQLTYEHNSDIVYHIRRAYEINISDKAGSLNQNRIRKPYLDLL